MKDHFLFIPVQSQELGDAGVEFMRGNPGGGLDVSAYVVGVADVDDGDAGGGGGGEEERGQSLGGEGCEGGEDYGGEGCGHVGQQKRYLVGCVEPVVLEFDLKNQIRSLTNSYKAPHKSSVIG